MGALATAWQARLSTQQQWNLTNPDVEGAVAVNATVLAAAETDATNQFFEKTGLAFDSTVSSHITLGVLGVTYFLYSYRGVPKSSACEAARGEWEKACASFARTRGALTWLSPTSDSLLSPTRDDPGSLPYFDRRNLSSMRPRQPLDGDYNDPIDAGRGE